FECALQKLLADAAPLLTGRYEQLRQEPQVATNPAEGEAQDLICPFRHPQAIRIVAQGKLRENRRTYRGHWPQAVTFAQVIQAVNDKLAGLLQILSVRCSVDDRHEAPTQANGRMF